MATDILRSASSHPVRVPPTRVVSNNQDWCVGTVANIVVAHWFVNTDPSGVHTLHDLLRVTATRFPTGVALVQWVAPGAQPPSSEVRRLLVEMLQTGPDAVKASSIIVPGCGFRFAAARAMVSGVALLARAKFPHVVHATTYESVQWLSKALASALTHEINELVTAIDTLPERARAKQSPS